MSPRMDITTSTPNPPFPSSSLSVTGLPVSGNVQAATPRASSPAPAIVGLAKPQLVPNTGSGDKLGATVTAEGITCAVYSETASALFVSLYDDADREIQRFELDGHENNIHHGLVAGIGPGVRYGLRADGPYD